MIEEHRPGALFDRDGKPYLTCWCTSKPRPAKPEEIVRQLYLRKLTDGYGYHRDRIALEKRVYFGSSVHEKAADVVVWEKDTTEGLEVLTCANPSEDGVPDSKTSFRHMAMGTLPSALCLSWCFVGSGIGDSYARVMNAAFV